MDEVIHSMNQVEREIEEAAKKLFSRLPEGLRDEVLLTGGTAAFLYGSDRPFSHDIDVMIPMDRMGELEEGMGLVFERHRKKAVFHSLKAILEEGGQTFDLIAQSIIEPEDSDISCRFELKPEIIRRKVSVQIGKMTLYLIPKELLVLIKLLAGRGKALGKYDLYDVRMILEKNDDFDFEFMKKMVLQCCLPLETILPVLISHAGKAGSAKLSQVLGSLRRSE